MLGFSTKRGFRRGQKEAHGGGNHPVITGYAGTTFRSQLEARWAAYFDERGIEWQYEPARFSGWTPDFRLVLNGVESYAEVKPVSEFPMDVAQRVLGAGCTGDILILGWSRATPGVTGATDGPRWTWPHDKPPVRAGGRRIRTHILSAKRPQRRAARH